MEISVLLQELENLATRLDIAVRYEDGDFNGGLCRIKDEQVIFVNKKLSPEKKVTLLAQELAKLDLNNMYILPNLRDRIYKEAS
ncbi:unnamed protein product, partial [marine sediment metagenome]